jgi:heterodisulfide reductase subunit C
MGKGTEEEEEERKGNAEAEKLRRRQVSYQLQLHSPLTMARSFAWACPGCAGCICRCLRTRCR